MMLPFSDKEASILLGATLMHWGVPFHNTTKRELTDPQQALVDAASDKLIALRKAHLRSQLLEARDVPLSDQEITLLIGVIENCLAECGNDVVELDLHLNTRNRKEVEVLVERLRLSLQR